MRVRAVLVAVVALVLALPAAPALADPSAPSIAWLAPGQGPITGGNVVTIHAHTIDMKVSVTIGKVHVSYHRMSATAIAVRIPAVANPEMVFVQVRTRYGTSLRTIATEYHYNWPRPVITSLNTAIASTTGSTNLIIRGRYLDQVRAVTVGGRPVRQPYPLSLTAVQIAVPAHPAGPAGVVVTTYSGSSAPSAAATLLYYPPAEIIDASATSGSVSGGAVVTFHGQNFRAPTTVRFGATPSPSVRVLSPSLLTAVAPPHAPGLVGITVTTPVGPATPENYPYQNATPYRYASVVTQHWSDPTTVDSAKLWGLSCPSTEFCMAADVSRGWVTRGPSGWTTAVPGPGPGHAGDHAAGNLLSCTSPTFCLSSDSQGSASVWDGTDWSAIAPVPASSSGTLGPVEHVTCSSPTFCVAVVGNDVSTWDGTSWTPRVRASQYPFFTSVSCWADGQCAALDEAGDLVELEAGVWTDHGSQVPQTGDIVVEAGTCFATLRCISGTTEGAAAATTGYTPTVLSRAVTSMVCSSISSCIAVATGVDNAGVELTTTATWDGTAWSTESTAPAVISAISCPQDRSCIVTDGGDVRTLTW